MLSSTFFTWSILEYFVPDLPFAKNAIRITVSDRGDKFDEVGGESALRSFYMDDLVKLIKTEDEVISVIKKLIELMRIVGLYLTKYQSYSKSVVDSLPVQNVGQSTVMFDQEGENIHLTLGSQLNTMQDSSNFSRKAIDTSSTMHRVLSTVSFMFY